ncbi:MAG: DnaB-like helicase C-terminal domain-containing protein [Candidatus Omnitrophica bacterium]|nr:DnaB-like helicase C-terminal domain-containing protein [Candidatus Omnitrophota bacterium]MBU1996201.1 DnaB-like helicase C-terminal domain-containing protein [Candidatus Omnitrophota bacterium]
MENNQLPFFDLDSVGGGDEFDFNSWAELIHSKVLVAEERDSLEELYESKEYIAGLSTGFKKIDVFARGLRNGKLIIIGGRPSMVKTALASSIVNNIVTQTKYSIAYFSLGLSRHQMIQRMITLKAKVDAHKVRSGFLSSEEWTPLTKASAELSEADIFIDDTSPVFIQELREKIIWLKDNRDIKLVVIDSIHQLRDFINVDGSSKCFDKVARSLKSLACEIELPVIVLSQVSEYCASQKRQYPQLLDLPGAGAIVNSADVVMFLHRDEYYEPTDENRGVAKLVFAKNNDGPLGTIELFFNKECMRFESVEGGGSRISKK